jgi:hypothetical protein
MASSSIMVKPVPECDHPFTIYAKCTNPNKTTRWFWMNQQANPLLIATKLLSKDVSDAALRTKLSDQSGVTRSYPKVAISQLFTASRHVLPRLTLADARVICEIIARVFEVRVLLAWNSAMLYFGEQSSDEGIDNIIAYCVVDDRGIMALLNHKCDVTAEMLQLVVKCMSS